LKPGDGLHYDQGVGGDDFKELIDEYAKAFNVDMTLYLWHFHADEEGGWNSIGRSFIRPPYERMPHIPVTPVLLFKIANKGYWDVPYPPHKLPRQRWDITIDQIFFVIVIACALYSCLK
jgi:hypothetical protein